MRIKTERQVRRGAGLTAVFAVGTAFAVTPALIPQARALELTPPADAPAAKHADARKVDTVDVSGDAQVATVLVHGWHDPAFSVFRLDDPKRVVVDLKGADVSALAAKGVIAGRGPVMSVSARQFDDPQASVGRIVIAVSDTARYDVAIAGQDLAISVRVDESAAKPLAQAASPAPAVSAPPASATASSARAPVVASGPSEGDNVVRVEVDRLPGKVTGGTRLLAAKLAGSDEHVTLTLTADGPVAEYRTVELKNPGRLAIDLHGFTHVPKLAKTAAGPVVDLRVARHEDRVRVVMETNADRLPAYSVKRTRDGISIALNSTEAPAPKPIASKLAVNETVPVKIVPAAKAAGPAMVRSLDVAGHGRTTKVVLALDGKVETTEEKLADGSHVLILKNARLQKELARKLDTSELEGPLASVAAYEEPTDGSVRIVAKTRATEPDVTDTITPLTVGPSFGLMWHFAGNGTRKIALAANTPGGFMGEAPAYAMAAGPRATPYTGRRVDFTAKDLDVMQFLQAIGEISKRNIVASDDVSGKISIRLRNVPWDEALDIVLRTKGLEKEEVGDVIRILPATRFRAEQKERKEQEDLKAQTSVLKVRLIPVNFAPAEEMATRVKEMLTVGRGSCTVDARTNILIVRDTAEALAKAELLVRTLDTQTPQVLIEARVIEASTTFTRSFGIQWGGNAIAAPAMGTATGLAFPNIATVSGVSNDGPISGNSTAPNYVVNFPTAVGQGNGAGLGFIFGSANGAQTLNLRLTAAELGGVIKTVSAPKAVTLDNQSATISQGLSIPYNVVSAAGANTAFVQARLSLQVTPHVTADGSVLLRISVTNNQPNTGVTGSNGQPSISTREANTNVLVKDGDTTVIGGIYTRQVSKTNNSVPYLADIPIIGELFKHSVDTDDRDEMLIFITPRIVNRLSSSVSTDTDLGGPPAAPMDLNVPTSSK